MVTGSQSNAFPWHILPDQQLKKAIQYYSDVKKAKAVNSQM